MKIVKGFVWKIVTDIAKEVWHSGIFTLYELREDGSESMIEEYEHLLSALENGLDIGIEVGHLPAELDNGEEHY